MRGLARLFVVLLIAAGLVALVIHLENRYACNMPETRQVGSNTLDEAADEPAADALADADAAGGEPAWPPPKARPWIGTFSMAETHAPLSNAVETGLAGPWHWNLDVRRCFWPAGAGGWETADGPVNLAMAALQPGPQDEASLAKPIASAPSQVPGSPAYRPATNRSLAQQPPDPAVEPASLVEPREARPLEPSEGLRKIETLELMRQLSEPEEQGSALARAELSRRGFGEVELALARRLFDPDPEVRKKLARSLPGLQSVDAAAWLLQLCKDEDVDVRRTAVTLMATTGDPGLLEQVESIARRDSDPQIRDMALQIGQQRDMAGSRGAPAGGGRSVQRGSTPY